MTSGTQEWIANSKPTMLNTFVYRKIISKASLLWKSVLPFLIPGSCGESGGDSSVPRAPKKGDSFIFRTVIKPEPYFLLRPYPHQQLRVYVYIVKHKINICKELIVLRDFGFFFNTEPSQSNFHSTTPCLPLPTPHPLTRSAFSKSVQHWQRTSDWTLGILSDLKSGFCLGALRQGSTKLLFVFPSSHALDC